MVHKGPGVYFELHSGREDCPPAWLLLIPVICRVRPSEVTVATVWFRSQLVYGGEPLDVQGWGEGRCRRWWTSSGTRS